jgi:integrase
VFKGRPLSAIRKQEIVDALDAIVERSMSTAIKAHKWLRRLFDWAVERGDIGASPMVTIPAPGTDGERERVLKGQELRAMWMGADAMPAPYASFIKMLALTGQRLREVAHMNWSEVDLDEAVWIIPGARTKNKLDHLVPLAPLAVSILSAIQPRKADRKGPVFTTDGAKPINGFSKPKAALDDKISAALAKLDGGSLPLMEPWVFHDLRRSFFTGGQALGFPREHMHAAVNHAADGKRAGLAKVYGLYEYQPEKTAVMAAWARHIEALLAGGVTNVVPLAAARA